MQYTVTWQIELVANSPTEAAEIALKMQRNPDSSATVFSVREDGSSIVHGINAAPVEAGGHRQPKGA